MKADSVIFVNTTFSNIKRAKGVNFKAETSNFIEVKNCTFINLNSSQFLFQNFG